MAVFTLTDVSFTYPQQREAALSHLDFTVEAGEFLLLCGASGSGKSTLLRLLKHSIAPSGTLKGEIRCNGILMQEMPERKLAGDIGFVFQNPDSQLVSDRVYNELAFALENLGVDPDVMTAKIAETAAFFGIERFFDRRTAELSGGEKQLLNLASVLVMEPSVLLLDEPLAQLDPIARLDFLSQLKRINRELGITVLLSEHMLDDVYALCDNVLVMEDGVCLFHGDKQEAAAYLLSTMHPLHKALPAACQIAWNCGKTSRFPLDVRECRQFLSKTKRPILQKKQGTASSVKKKEVLSCKHISFGYRQDKMVLADFSLSLQEGSCTALIGGNGAGKSTLLALITGFLKPVQGKIKCALSRVVCLPQNPYTVFIEDTVEKDLDQFCRQNKIGKEEKKACIGRYPFFCGIETLFSRNPFDLSGGEVQRMALLKLLLAGGELILLDEPTKGLDAPARETLLAMLGQLKQEGRTLLLVSHDLDFIARCADQCMMLFRGQAVSSGTPRYMFCANRFYTTQVRRITEGFAASAVTLEDMEAVR